MPADLDAAVDVHDDGRGTSGQRLIGHPCRRHVVTEHHQIVPSLGGPDGDQPLRVRAVTIGKGRIGTRNRGRTLRSLPRAARNVHLRVGHGTFAFVENAHLRDEAVHQRDVDVVADLARLPDSRWRAAGDVVAFRGIDRQRQRRGRTCRDPNGKFAGRIRRRRSSARRAGATRGDECSRDRLLVLIDYMPPRTRKRLRRKDAALLRRKPEAGLLDGIRRMHPVDRIRAREKRGEREGPFRIGEGDRRCIVRTIQSHPRAGDGHTALDLAHGAGEGGTRGQADLDGHCFRAAGGSDVAAVHGRDRLPAVGSMGDGERPVVTRLRQRPAVDRNDGVRDRIGSFDDAAANGDAAAQFDLGRVRQAAAGGDRIIGMDDDVAPTNLSQHVARRARPLDVETGDDDRIRHRLAAAGDPYGTCRRRGQNDRPEVVAVDRRDRHAAARGSVDRHVDGARSLQLDGEGSVLGRLHRGHRIALDLAGHQPRAHGVRSFRIERADGGAGDRFPLRIDDRTGDGGVGSRADDQRNGQGEGDGWFSHICRSDGSGRKTFHDCNMSMCAGEIRGSLAVISGGARIGAVGEEEIDDVFVAKLRGSVQGGVSKLLARVCVGAAVKEQPHRGGVADGSRGVNRRHAKGVARCRVHLRPALDQRPRQIGLAKEDCQSERRESIFRIRIEQRGIAVEHPQRQRRITERARLAERQHRAAIEKQPRKLRMSVVNREEDRRNAILPRPDQRAIPIEQRRD